MVLIKYKGIKEGEIFNKWLHSRLIRHNKNVLSAELGATGCSPKGSKVLMANGEWKNIEDIKQGDEVLSPQKDGNNTYEKVIGTTSWFSKENYSVIQKNKENKKLYSCSYNHLIPVYHNFSERGTKDGKRYYKKKWWDFKKYEAQQFFNMSGKIKNHQNIGFSSFVINNFKGRMNCKIEPYTLGVFLGDGMFKDDIKLVKNKNYNNQKRKDKKLLHIRNRRVVAITSDDFEIMDEVSKYYPVMSVFNKQKTTAKSYYFSINSEFPNFLKKYGLNGKKSGTKFIPKDALLSDVKYRKRLLAGLIDTDGYYGKKRGGYSFTLKSKQLIEDIRDLVYSLGGRCGKLRKIKKGIKSIGFVGTYYNLNFYLGHLNLPLKCERKKRDVSTIYLNSNRIAIDLKKSKVEQVYGFSITGNSKWYITDNWMVTHNSGKSYRDLRKAELWYEFHFNKKFPAENICFGVAQTMEILASGKLKRGDILVIEEAGVNLGSRNWQSKVSKMFNFVLQSFRSMNIGLFFNLPYLSMLDSQARHLLHYYAESSGINFETKTNECKPFFLQVAQSSGKIYRHYPKVKLDGRTIKVNRFVYSLPSKYLIDAYEDKKAKYLKNLIKEYADKTNGDNSVKKKPITPLEYDCHQLYYGDGLSYGKVAKIKKINIITATKYVKRVEKWKKENEINTKVGKKGGIL